nr:hypothetical protein HmN_000994400 [Hymenolepis microstoma]
MFLEERSEPAGGFPQLACSELKIESLRLKVFHKFESARRKMANGLTFALLEFASQLEKILLSPSLHKVLKLREKVADGRTQSGSSSISRWSLQQPRRRKLNQASMVRHYNTQRRRWKARRLYHDYLRL